MRGRGPGRAGLLLAPRSSLSSVICHLSSASRPISVAHCKELFKPSSPRIICREMEMHQIRYFLAISEYLNVHRAAEECPHSGTMSGQSAIAAQK